MLYNHDKYLYITHVEYITGDVTCKKSIVINLTLSCSFIALFPSDCEAPPQIKDGERSFTDTVYLSMVYYSCDEGYNMTSGDSSLQCGPDYRWIGDIPQCTIYGKCDLLLKDKTCLLCSLNILLNFL